ncbi:MULTISPECIES: aspartate transaminase [unclassified Rhodococcus (in: high G+C Gram-positive bacteria)]|jgi:aspartate aminotransferase|uniref:aspartate transaminase n=1 Tax=unclassified Rhodococcus (in: high G+C Gram-positive bacteria) TaxID=192944 RepID=UPI000300ED2C|nr:aspartate transaminase [Rhodococcus sp. DK17]
MSTFVPAARVDQMRESPSVAAAQRVRELRASGREILDLTVGEPDFDTPDHIKAAAVAAMESGLTKYTPVNGIPALRDAISKRMLDRTGVEFTDNEITVGGGAKQVIFLALMATVEEGTEVIVPAPYWVSYPDMVTVHGGTPVVVDCQESDRFLLTADKLAAAITPSTKWVILNAPSNPTGAVYSERELAELAAVLDRNPHVNVLCDEIYDEIVFTDSPVPNLLSAAPHLRDRILVTNGVSKAYAMTGWRLGYGVGNKGLIAAINKLQSQSSSCPSSISQAAAAEALTGDQSFVATSGASYRARRDLIFELFSRIEGLEPVLPQGAFYLFVGCAGLVGKRTPDGTLLENDQDVVLFLLDHASVATIQGSAYGAESYFRVSFATSEDVLRNAAAAVEKAVASLS